MLPGGYWYIWSLRERELTWQPEVEMEKSGGNPMTSHRAKNILSVHQHDQRSCQPRQVTWVSWGQDATEAQKVTAWFRAALLCLEVQVFKLNLTFHQVNRDQACGQTHRNIQPVDILTGHCHTQVYWGTLISPEKLRPQEHTRHIWIKHRGVWVHERQKMTLYQIWHSICHRKYHISSP